MKQSAPFCSAEERELPVPCVVVGRGCHPAPGALASLQSGHQPAGRIQPVQDAAHRGTSDHHTEHLIPQGFLLVFVLYIFSISRAWN